MMSTAPWRCCVIVGLSSCCAEPYAAPVLTQLSLPIDCYAWSHDVEAIKPDPRIYAYVLQQLGCAAEEMLFVGDSVKADLAGPTRIGMQAPAHCAREAFSASSNDGRTQRTLLSARRRLIPRRELRRLDAIKD
ncbi:HAD family hydrolase [Chitinimonas sp. PSY-7]|uniref:HAD-IA family hydrolase n=1 Tax=Chitinimonas sp. PSY-7 TaxID=3459088 RepID=UPI00403FD105